MSPTLPDQSLFLSTTLFGNLEPESIVVLKDPHHDYSKPQTFIEKYIRKKNLLVKRVKSRNPINNKLWLRGDNLKKSEDSRKWGEVREGMIVEVVIGRVWPRPRFWGWSDDGDSRDLDDKR
ncbi:hypothetical protein TrLO_g5266 [Triparma laevis f. longispina]|uniref:Mitochondrial inner membrane protease subunit 2 n=1 Tax=Triparma laevis f. longispina TaxID=1714387 RepID=A0A9W7L0U5_9STRA|nr:hypothetical protein TrLO_g5266 [Triparma laevis f. longispina]